MLQLSWHNNTPSIIFLVVACIFVVLSGLCVWWTVYCLRNKADPNLAETKNWFMKWLYKNRMIWSLMITVIVVLLTVVFFLSAFGVVINFPTPD